MTGTGEGAELALQLPDLGRHVVLTVIEHAGNRKVDPVANARLLRGKIASESTRKRQSSS